MNTSLRAGFTIIETTLFLAVTGLLILMILTGTGFALSTQRYKDAVQTFKSDIQAQYAELSSVQNGRSASKACSATAVPVDSTTPERVGQSDCLVAGRYVQIVSDKMTVYNVIAYQTNKTVTAGAKDIAVMKANYRYGIDASTVSEKTLEWGTRISWPKTKGFEHTNTTAGNRSLGLLFIRSPYSGQIYTFSATQGGTISDAHIKSIMQEGATVSGGTIGGQAARIICIESDGLVATGNESLYINRNATSAGAVEQATNEVLKTKVPSDQEKPAC